MPEEKEGGFKVSDRRLFNPDGTLREEASERETPANNAAAAPPPVAPVNAQPQRAPEPAPNPAFAQPPEEEMPEATEFMEFLMGVASSAFIHLGLMEHPATGTRQVDLRSAQQSIEMLVMLREKTRGNLTREEESFFEDLLADLRMQFVALRR
jgi:hypothetical protein